MVSRETPPAGLPAWLEAHREGLSAFDELLATVGVERGLIGPREVDRIWQRHLLNCAAVADPADQLVPAGARVADVGSGAGLPGLVWAIVRPDVSLILIEPLLRRSTFLTEATEALGLSARVQVLRGRAEDATREPGWLPVQVVTARAVAPLPRLLGWTVPLLAAGGSLVALKGSSAQQELQDASEAVAASGLVDVTIREVGATYLEQPTTVITGRRGAAQ